jgi:hypothetical protein
LGMLVINVQSIIGRARTTFRSFSEHILRKKLIQIGPTTECDNGQGKYDINEKIKRAF